MKIGSKEYPEKVIKAFANSFPVSAQVLADYLAGTNNNRLPLEMLEAFYEGWKAKK